ncbi:MAG: hypothetical protein O2820_06225 [Planctomycetota bacterium]|nr:hypothetical protein [Planctomycetota bacterium]MDA1248805.1 hypothetical protein [Planctomycetota bacterium]
MNDTTPATRVHAERADPVDRLRELEAAIVAAELPAAVRESMLPMLEVCRDFDSRLDEFAGVLLRVRRWDEHFEVAQTRRIKGVPKWIALAVKHDGSRYRRLIEGRNGAARFGVWVLFCQVAVKCPVRGLLADEDGPLSLEDIALKTGCPIVSILDALPALLSIRWLEVAPVEAETVIEVEAAETVDSATSRNSDSKVTSDRNPDLMIPAEVVRLVEAWNDLPAGIVTPVNPSELPALCSAWQRLEKDRTADNARELLSRPEDIVEELRASKFLRGKSWLTLPWLLKRERDGPQFNVEKLAAGCYRDGATSTAGADKTLDALTDF